MNELKLELYWNEIPVEKENAITYAELTTNWNVTDRQARQILHELSAFDNGDNYVLIRSARNKGFYRTDDLLEMRKYKQECLNKGRSLFAPIKKINRVINANTKQFQLANNMRVIRESRNLKQADVVKQLKPYDKSIDKSMLSKMENNVCLPTLLQLVLLAKIYGCEPYELINGDLYF